MFTHLFSRSFPVPSAASVRRQVTAPLPAIRCHPSHCWRWCLFVCRTPAFTLPSPTPHTGRLAAYTAGHVTFRATCIGFPAAALGRGIVCVRTKLATKITLTDDARVPSSARAVVRRVYNYNIQQVVTTADSPLQQQQQPRANGRSKII